MVDAEHKISLGKRNGVRVSRAECGMGSIMRVREAWEGAL